MSTRQHKHTETGEAPVTLTDAELKSINASGAPIHTPRSERHDPESYIPVGGHQPGSYGGNRPRPR